MTLHALLFGDGGPVEVAPAAAPVPLPGKDLAYFEMFREFNSERAFFDFARSLQAKPDRGLYSGERIAEAG